MTIPAPVFLEGAGLALNIVGGLRGSRAARAEAARRRALANLNAQRRAASGQQAAFEEERQARLAQSRALAIAAASGRGAGPRTQGDAASIEADIGGEGAYRAALQVYEAEEDARMIRLGGQLEASALNDQARAGQIGTAASVFSGAASMYANYGGGGFKGSGVSGST